MPPQKHIHFMGIAGSGVSAVAQIAASQGYQISGCDLNLNSPYFHHLKSQIPNLRSFTGHDPEHLNGVDLLAVTPAVFYQNNTHPEVELAKKTGALIKWQDFLGKYLHQNKFLISVAGTHGKSTTTSIIGLLLESAGLDPTVEVGATVSQWHNNVRIGKSEYFVSEADEFHNNFSSYQSNIIVLTLLEMDHPEYFKTRKNLISSFQNFIDHAKPGAVVIYNSDSVWTKYLKFPPNSIPYSITQITNSDLSTSGSSFSYQGQNYRLKIPGRHNISNCLAVINLARILNISPQIAASALEAFTGIGRRLELLGQKNGIRVFDDYANHPSSFAASISGVKQLFPNSEIIVVIEPHTYSRLHALLSELPKAVRLADEIIVSKIFSSRETDPGNFSGTDIVAAMHHPNARYIPDFPDIIDHLKRKSRPNDVILVMGSGNSYQLSRDILKSL